ncbi:hypothetical protein AGMMS49991_07700 [Spirochaetia bacterium]|nr:hypothetical protein AGMMS49991_07700 [Spirochaetia bacterium]
MANLLEQAVDSILKGIEDIYLSDGMDAIVASLVSTSSVSEKYRFPEFSASFEKANAYLGTLLASHAAGTPINGVSFVSKVNYLVDVLTSPKAWCENIFNDPSSTEDDKELAYSLYDKYCTAVGNLRTCLKKIGTDITAVWIPGTEPLSFPDIPELPILNRK